MDTKLNDCSLTCLVEFQREQLCSNPQVRSKIDNCIIVIEKHYCTFDIINDIIANSRLLQEAVTHDPSLTFWTYLLVRTLLGVLTAARFLIMIMS